MLKDVITDDTHSKSSTDMCRSTYYRFPFNGETKDIYAYICDHPFSMRSLPSYLGLRGSHEFRDLFSISAFGSKVRDFSLCPAEDVAEEGRNG